MSRFSEAFITGPNAKRNTWLFDLFITLPAGVAIAGLIMWAVS